MARARKGFRPGVQEPSTPSQGTGSYAPTEYQASVVASRAPGQGPQHPGPVRCAQRAERGRDAAADHGSEGSQPGPEDDLHFAGWCGHQAAQRHPERLVRQLRNPRG
jgi:hypothetical protein